jgi:parallel beta-helix repeat protein
MAFDVSSITQNNLLVLEADLKCEDNDGIIIHAPYFTLDCNGHTVFFVGDTDIGYDGIILGFDSSPAVIKNYNFEGWPEDGLIAIDGASTTIENCKSNSNDRHGLRVADASSVTVKDSEFNNNGKNGIFLEEGSGNFYYAIANENGGINIELSEREFFRRFRFC